MTLFLDAPHVGDLEKKYIGDAIDSTFVSTIGPFVPKFESTFADYLGVPKTVAVQSGTAALHMALVALGVTHVDEVIVPSLTFVASINPILYAGATPVFVDVDPDTWTLNPDAVKSAITSKTKAIIPVHLYGVPGQMDAIISIAKEHGLLVIEDATESIGASLLGAYTGTWGDLGCFSFNGNKVLTTGGGGMVVGYDEDQIERIKFLVNQARVESKGYYHSEMGYNYRMTNIEAAMGLAQFSQLAYFLDRKKRYRQIFEEALGDSVVFQQAPTAGKSSHWFTAIRRLGKSAEELQTRLKEKGVVTRRNFVPAHHFPYLQKFVRSAMPVTEMLYDEGLCLPSSTLNDPAEVQKGAWLIEETIKELS